VNSLKISNLHVSVEDKEIIKGLDLEIKQGEIHAIMGPNGSGKSTLAYALAGHPSYTITQGTIELDGQDITELSPDKRAIAGLFLAQQLPTEVEGITFSNFLRVAYGCVKGETPPIREWVSKLSEAMESLQISSNFASRSLNVGFSGGEKKRAEILQLKLLEPKYAILDETDSGLDVDALKVVAQGILDAQKQTGFGALLVTHHTHLLDYIKPDFVHVFVSGKIHISGTSELAEELVREGYQKYQTVVNQKGDEK
jgi:Fe-S cluster assembly ATP-binding protein